MFYISRLFYITKVNSKKNSCSRNEYSHANNNVKHSESRTFLAEYITNRIGALADMLQLDTKLAEREGFEPPEGCPSTVFKTAALNRSATSP